MTTTVFGGASRQQAADKSEAELRKFDRNVSIQLKRRCGGVCPMGWDWYATRQGYLCGGGSHFIEHEDVETMLKHGALPQRLEMVIESVNGTPYDREVTPPPGNGNGTGEEPAFWTAEQQWALGVYLFARLRDPKHKRMDGLGPGGRRGGGHCGGPGSGFGGDPFGDWEDVAKQRCGV
jgi:hypothetical protein